MGAGEHNGTFRGNNLGFVAATEALNYWKTKDFQLDIGIRENRIRQSLEGVVKDYPQLGGEIRGRGMIQGLLLISRSSQAGCPSWPSSMD